MSCIKTFQFSSAVRGFHCYRSFWIPQPEQVLNCSHEIANTFDRFAIKVCETEKDEIVGHLPMEISRITKFLIGANVSAKLRSTNYRRSPLVQGGLEISCIVTVSMSGTVVNQLLIERYKQLVEKLYIELKNEEILGSFLNFEGVAKESPAPAPKKKKKIPEPPNNQKDIRFFFTAGVKNVEKESKEKHQDVITIE